MTSFAAVRRPQLEMFPAAAAQLELCEQPAANDNPTTARPRSAAELGAESVMLACLRARQLADAARAARCPRTHRRLVREAASCIAQAFRVSRGLLNGAYTHETGARTGWIFPARERARACALSAESYLADMRTERAWLALGLDLIAIKREAVASALADAGMGEPCEELPAETYDCPEAAAAWLHYRNAMDLELDGE